MGRLFGTDGIRSRANEWPLTVGFVLRIGQAVAQTVGGYGRGRPEVVIGRDTRNSGRMLESALTAGLMSHGVDVLRAGIITTPGVAFLTRKKGMRLGIVISASHNPFDHNGIKIFGSEGFKIPDEQEAEIERLLLDADDEVPAASTHEIGSSRDVSVWREDYVSHLVSVWGSGASLEGAKIVLDCANGATAGIAPEVFRRIGARVVARESQPDGLNINQNYEYIYPESLRRAVLEETALVGIAFDGDGDRVMLVDEAGGFVNGDAVLAILARAMKRDGSLTNGTVVSTPMSNWGLKASLEEADIRLEEVSVGDRFVLQRMIESNYSLGGEQSGHVIILRDDQTTGDGILTSLEVLKVMCGDQRGLSSLAAVMEEFPEYLANIEVPSKPPLAMIPEIQEALEGLRASLGGDVDIVLRYSGTESKLRLKIRAGREHDPLRLAREAEAFMEVAKRAIA
jgi:phosphoglucosamine mutase